MIFLIATLTIKPGSLDAIRKAVQPCIEATREELGCISYSLHQNLSDENELVFVERWETRAALEAHFEQPHLIAWREAGEQYFLNRKIEIIEPESVDVR